MEPGEIKFALAVHVALAVLVQLVVRRERSAPRQTGTPRRTGRPVILTVWGSAHPPVSLHVEE